MIRNHSRPKNFPKFSKADYRYVIHEICSRTIYPGGGKPQFQPQQISQGYNTSQQVAPDFTICPMADWVNANQGIVIALAEPHDQGATFLGQLEF